MNNEQFQSATVNREGREATLEELESRLPMGPDGSSNLEETIFNIISDDSINYEGRAFLIKEHLQGALQKASICYAIEDMRSEIKKLSQLEKPKAAANSTEHNKLERIALDQTIIELRKRITALESDNARLRNVIIEANRKETQY